MLSLFAPKLPIDPDELEWQLATFKWLGTEFGASDESPLVLPTAEYFPPSPRKGAGRVEDLFASVKAAAGLTDWPCELRAGAGDRPAMSAPACSFATKARARRAGRSRSTTARAGRRW